MLTGLKAVSDKLYYFDDNDYKAITGFKDVGINI